MKKLMTLMLGMMFVLGTTTAMFAQEKSTEQKTEKSKGKKKGGKKKTEKTEDTTKK